MSIQTIEHETLPVPQWVKHNTYCMIEFTPKQRQYLASRSIFKPVGQPSSGVPVPDDPHAMLLTEGISMLPDGREVPHKSIERVPGVLVESDQFVLGFRYGMLDAYMDSDDGEEPVTEQAVIGSFSELAADAVMLGNEEVPTDWSAGYMFGYVHGCSLIGTQQFQCWANGEMYTTFS
jgi:hypothetical protein